MQLKHLVVDEPCRTKLPDISVRCEHRSESNDGHKADLLKFYDNANGECFLTISTAHTDDYYTYCVIN